MKAKLSRKKEDPSDLEVKKKKSIRTNVAQYFPFKQDDYIELEELTEKTPISDVKVRMLYEQYIFYNKNN